MAGYDDRFWIRAIELATKNPKECEECHRPNGWTPKEQDGKPKKKRIPLMVRVALRQGMTIHTGNLGLFCTHCRRGPYQVKMKQGDLDRLVLPLFS